MASVFDDYRAWERWVLDDWRPDWADAGKSDALARAQALGVLWAIVQSGYAGRNCGIGDVAVGQRVGLHRSQVGRYRHFFLRHGVLRYNGRNFGRVKCVDIAGPMLCEHNTNNPPSGDKQEHVHVSAVPAHTTKSAVVVDTPTSADLTKPHDLVSEQSSLPGHAHARTREDCPPEDYFECPELDAHIASVKDAERQSEQERNCPDCIPDPDGFGVQPCAKHDSPPPWDS